MTFHTGEPCDPRLESFFYFIRSAKFERDPQGTKYERHLAFLHFCAGGFLEGQYNTQSFRTLHHVQSYNHSMPPLLPSILVGIFVGEAVLQ